MRVDICRYQEYHVNFVPQNENFKNFLNLATVKLLTIENIKKVVDIHCNEEYHVNFVPQNENFKLPEF